MNLAIAVNHSAPFHVGGSEKVVQQISESMLNSYNINCTIFTKYVKNDNYNYNGINIVKCSNNNEDFIKQLNNSKIDHLLVYSDCFSYWPAILKNVEKFSFKNSICLVGMNHMLGDSNTRKMFEDKHEYFNIITHSDLYQDYSYCKNKNIPVHVIPNGIDFNEFSDKKFSFKEKYGIKTQKMILCVSNFFPGKGQEYLISILNKVYSKYKDFTIVFICSTVSFYVANNLMHRFNSMLSKNAKFKYVFLKDIPREDTIQSFLESDFFVFPSQQEVAPLVLLECMATNTPWISLDVGNASSLAGGVVIKSFKKINNQYVYDDYVFESFEKNILDFLTNDEKLKYLASAGYDFCLKNYNWENIKEKYYKIFNNEL